MIDQNHFAAIILQQLGGNKFLVMTGTKQLIYCNDRKYLSMKLTRNLAGAKYLKVSLGSMDSYTMTFSKVVKTKNKEYSLPGLPVYNETLVTVKEFTGIYCDQLQELFTQVTGLYTSLGTMGR